MPDHSLLTWIRLVDGRLWHIATDNPVATRCGREAAPAGTTLLPERAPAPPANGWVCDRCVRRQAEQAAAARQAWLTDPRRRPGDQLPGPDDDPPPDAEIRANNIPAEVTPGQPTDDAEETDH